MAQNNTDQFNLIKDKQDELVLAATNLALVVAPHGVDLGPIVDDSTGALLPMPEGAFSLGEVQKQAGSSLTPSLSTEGVQGYGSRASRRIFITEEGFTIDVTLQEIRKQGYQMWLGVEDEDIENSAYVTRLKKRPATRVKYWTAALIGLDHSDTGEIFPFFKFPKVALTQKGAMSLAEASEMGMPLTLTMFEDKGEHFEVGLGGTGWPSLAAKAGFELPSGA